jgi:hypothetical protein
MAARAQGPGVGPTAWIPFAPTRFLRASTVGLGRVLDENPPYLDGLRVDGGSVQKCFWLFFVISIG